MIDEKELRSNTIKHHLFAIVKEPGATLLNMTHWPQGREDWK